MWTSARAIPLSEVSTQVHGLGEKDQRQYMKYAKRIIKEMSRILSFFKEAEKYYLRTNSLNHNFYHLGTKYNSQCSGVSKGRVGGVREKIHSFFYLDALTI